MEIVEALAASIKTWHSLHSTLVWVPHRAALRNAKAGECLRRKETGKAAAQRRCAYTAAKITVRIMREVVYSV
jgi:hypothetical protein